VISRLGQGALAGLLGIPVRSFLPMIALPVGPLALAIEENTRETAYYLRGEALEEVPVWRMIATPLEEIERIFITETLKLTGGNREQAASLLGIGERTLYRKIKEYGFS